MTEKRVPMHTVKAFLESWIPSGEDPLLPLCAGAMKTHEFNRGNMLSPAESKFESVDPPQHRFSSMIERAVKLAYGTLYEQLFNERKRAVAAKQELNCRAIGVESSKVNGMYTRYLILVEDSDDLDLELMPKIGKEDIALELAVPGRFPDLPQMDFSSEQRAQSIRTHLQRGFRSALDICGHRSADPKLLLSMMMSFIMDVWGDQKQIGSKDTMTFIAGAASHLKKQYSDPKAEEPEDSWDDW